MDEHVAENEAFSATCDHGKAAQREEEGQRGLETSNGEEVGCEDADLPGRESVAGSGETAASCDADLADREPFSDHEGYKAGSESCTSAAHEQDEIRSGRVKASTLAYRGYDSRSECEDAGPASMRTDPVRIHLAQRRLKRILKVSRLRE